MWALLATVALSADVSSVGLPPRPERPVAPAPTPLECPAAVALVPGQPIPPSLVDADGLVRCGAVAVPSSEVAQLLSMERYADGMAGWAHIAEQRHELEIAILRRDLEHTQALLAEAERPDPLLLRPGVQRTLGRVETLITVAAVGAVAYAVTRGSP